EPRKDALRPVRACRRRLRDSVEQHGRVSPADSVCWPLAPCRTNVRPEIKRIIAPASLVRLRVAFEIHICESAKGQGAALGFALGPPLALGISAASNLDA